MASNFARMMILLFLHTAQTQENPKLEPIVASPGEDVQISCHLPYGSQGQVVTWYKEREDRSLNKIYESYRNSNPEGKYSGQVPNLTISSVQRNDSGVYYCASGISWKFSISTRARLIVTDTSRRPSHSILVPFPLEGTQPNRSIPLLCLTFDANPTWHNFSWEISEELFQDQKGVGVIDEEGVFSIWHLEMIPLKEWTEEKAYPCWLQENGNTTEVMLIQQTGNCFAYVYFGVPSIIILLVLSLILLFRKHRARENSEQRANQIPRVPQEIPQTNYAEVGYKHRNALCVD